MGSGLAALLGAVIGGVLSVLASWVAQRTQSKSQRLVQEISQRQRLYSEFIEVAAQCYAEALEKSEPSSSRLAKLYAQMGRMKLLSSEAVVSEANRIAHGILDAYVDTNRSSEEIRDLLAHDSVDLFSPFAEACREELRVLDPEGVAGLHRLQPFKAPATDTPN